MKTKKNVVTSLITLKWLLLFGLATVIVGAALPKFASLAASGSFGSAVSKKFAFLLPPAGSALQFDGTNDHVTFGNTRLLPGTLVNTPTWNSQANSQLGRSSLTFNGTSQYVTFGAAPELNAADFTIETWFYWTGAGAATSTGTGGITAIPLVTKGRAESEAAGLNANYFLGIVGGKLAADFEALSDGANYPITGATTITTNTWHHAAVTYDGSCWQLYLDGAPDLAAANCPGVAPDNTSTQHAAIGTAMTSSGAAAGFFSGRMDEVRIWNVARSQSEIQAAMNSEILTPTTGLLGRWGLNDGAGTTASNLNRLGVTSFTLEAWVKRDAGGSTMSTGTNGFDGNSGRPLIYPVVTRGMGEGESPANINTNYFMGITADGFIGADFEDTAGGVNHPAWGTTTVPVGEWHHLAATYNGSCWSLYFDGNLDTLNAAATICPNATPESTSYQHPGLAAALNSTGGLATGYFAGIIDEARVWDHALLQSEIQTNKNLEITSASGLLARWGMNEGSGTTTDSSVGLFPGALTNGPLWVNGFPINDSTPPAAPTTLQASAGNSLVNLSWTAPPDLDVAGYNVYRSTSPSVLLTSPVNGGTLVNGTAYSDTGLANGQIYYYVVTAVDTSTNESLASNEVNATPAIAPGALEFTTASGTYVTFGDPAKLDLATFTIETWFKRTGTGTSNTTGTGGITIVPLLTHGSPEAENSNVDANWILGINTTGNVIAADFEAIDDPAPTGQNFPISGTTAITDNVWHHAAATFDGTTWSVYLDGNLEASINPGVHPRSDSVQPVALGTMIDSSNTPHGYFQGVIDEARVWNVARSQPQIMADINNELTSGSGLVARWGLNDGTGTVVGDSIATVADGTIVGTNYSWVTPGAPFNIAPSNAPDDPTLNSPTNGATGVGIAPTLDVNVSDPDNDPLTVTFYGRPYASGIFTQIGQNTGVVSGSSTATSWASLDQGQKFEWYVTVSDGAFTTTGPTWTFNTAPGADPVFVGVGDIASCAVTEDTATGELISGIEGMIFTTGDNVYPNGTAAEFASCYATTPWGNSEVLSRTYPVPGNHDWGTGATENLNGYFGYYGDNANQGGTSYYSYDIDSYWHVVNLDSECQLVPGGCGVGSPQETWLIADLAANPTKNVIAIWHKPRYSSGATNYQALQPLWDALYNAGVDILLDGHDHIYERFEPMKSGATPSDPPVADPQGIRQFTVGMGGESHHGFGTTLATSQVRNNTDFGIFKLTLHPTSYDWKFFPIAGSTFTDSGSDTVNVSNSTFVSFQDGVNSYTGTRDTYIWETSPTTVRGLETTMVQDINTSDERRSLLSFDLSSIPANATIVSAELQFYVDTEGQGFNMYRMKVPWDEATVTYASIGNRHFEADGIDADTTVDANWCCQDGYVGSITVSSTSSLNSNLVPTIQGWVDGTSTNNGWLMIATDLGGDGQQLRTREHGTIADHPKLTVEYTVAPPVNHAPDQPVLVSPADDATNVVTPPNLEVSVSDQDGDDTTVTFYGRPVGASPPGPDFTIIAIPDTQHYTDNGGANAANFAAQTQWIYNNKDALNIKFVTGLGDIVENGNSFDSEWQIADNAYSTIETSTMMLPDGISYGLAVGNHDESPLGGGDTADTTKYNQYFGISRFMGRSYYGGHFGSDNDNNYELFSAGGLDFIIIHFEYDTTPDPSLLTWGNNLLQTNSNRRAIAVTHNMLGTGNPGSFSTQGQAIYDALKGNSNLFLMLGGHVPGEGRREDTFSGNTVNSLLADYQSRSNGGDGWLRIMTFSPANNTISVKTYSPTLNQFETDADSQFTLSYDMAAASVPFDVIGTNTNVTSGSNTSVSWSGLSAGTEYEWYATVSDGTEVTPGSLWSFTTETTGATFTLDYAAGAGGTLTGNTSQVVNSGADGTAVTAVPDAGYHFVNWSDASTDNPRTDTNVMSNISVTANFAINTYALTYTAGTGGTLTGTTSQTVNHGADGTAVTAVPDAGYHFVNWSDSSTDNPRTDTNVTADITVTANFAINQYTLSYTAGANGTLTGTTSQTVNHGADGTAVTAVPDAGYHFVDWSDASTANPRTDTNVTADITVTANFAINTYTLTYNAGANGSITGTTPQTVNSGADGTAVTAVPDAGYHFVDWSDASTDNPRTDTNVTADITVTANFAIDQFTIDASAAAGGSINPNGAVLLNYDASQAFTITPDLGYHVADVLVDTVSVGAVTSYTFNNVMANHTIAVSFAVDTFTIDVSAGANGSISPSGSVTVNYDGSQAFTITPDAGYQISNVLVDSVSVGAVSSYTFNNVTANHTIAATFSQTNVYTISGNIQQYNFPAANTNLSGVTVNLDGDQTGSTMTDGSGNFNFTGLASGGNYLITPTLAGYNFDPMNRSYSNVSANITTADFTGYTGNSQRVISVGSQNVVPGSQAVVPINLVSQGNENSVGFSISYDPAVLSNPVVAVGADCGDCSLIVNDSIAGQLAIIASKPSGMMFAVSPPAREMVTITFNTTPTPPMYTGSLITFGDTPVLREVTNTNADPLFATYSDGAVTFATGYESDVAPRSAGSNTGGITVADYTQTGRFAAGLDTFNPLYNELQRADSAPRATRGNGLISVADYTQAGRYAAGLDSVLGVGGPAFSSLFSSPEISNKQRGLNPLFLPRILRAVDVSTSPGQQVIVSIQIDAEGDENGFGFTISYDGSKLSNPAVMTGADLAGAVPIPNTNTPGKVGVIIAHPVFGGTIPMGTREIVKIRFDVSPTAPAGPTPIIFTGFPPVENEVSDAFANVLTTTFMDGTVEILGTTAAHTSVGGIVRSANGRAISRARITLTDPSGFTRIVMSNMFGYFRFDDVAVGETYVIRVRAKTYNFVPHVISVRDQVTNLNLVAEP